ncbi:hypothetical protein ACFLTE_10865, partial [Bacteroidota bacterium]
FIVPLFKFEYLVIYYMKRLLILLALTSFIASCQQKDFKVDISNINVDIEISRFEMDLFEIEMDSMAIGIDMLKKKYGSFFDLYAQQVLRIGHPNSSMFSDNIKSFITDYNIYKSYEEVQVVYNSLNEIEHKLSTAFSYYKYYFPEKQVPAIYTIMTGFNQSIVIDEGIIAVSLEKYLGKNCEFYDWLMVSNYLRINMHPGMIVSDCMKAWALTEYEFNDSVNNLINNMIYNGKTHYFQRCMLPNEQDSIIFGFTGKQIEWCKRNEENMWMYLIDNKLLYNNDFLMIRKFTEPSPFTKNFSNQSPGRAANWLGYKIVERYMNKNREVSLKELMELNEYQVILQKAKYRP